MQTISNRDHSHSHSHKHSDDLPLHKHSHYFEPEINTFAHFKQHIARDKDARKLCILLMINLVVTVLEVVYGFISNSIGLISDAAHMLFDSTALAVGVYASYKAKLPANKKFSYGYERFQTLAGFINGIFLIFIAFYILIESLERIYDPPVIHSEKMIVVAIIGLVVNLIGVLFFHEHAHLHEDEGHSHHGHSHSHAQKKDQHHHESHEHSHNHSLNSTSHVDSSVPSTQNSLKEPSSLEDTDQSSHRHQHGNGCNHDHELEQLHQPSQNPQQDDEHDHDHEHEHEGHHHHHNHDGPNENLNGVFLHILADLLGSVGVIASSILIMLFGWYVTDAICSAITSVLILVSVIPLLKSSVMVFMQTYPSKHEKQFTQILSDISNHPAVLECKDPHLWAFTHEKLVCSMILVLKHNTPDINKVVKFAKEKLNQIQKIKYITIDYKVDKS